jgi:hypothetical protein
MQVAALLSIFGREMVEFSNGIIDYGSQWFGALPFYGRHQR